jgi:hypothetical protein
MPDKMHGLLGCVSPSPLLAREELDLAHAGFYSLEAFYAIVFIEL